MAAASLLTLLDDIATVLDDVAVMSKSVVGTAAMFLVGGSILVHGLAFLHPITESLAIWTQSLGSLAVVGATVSPLLFDLVVGFVLGSLLVLVIHIINTVKQKWRAQ